MKTKLTPLASPKLFERRRVALALSLALLASLSAQGADKKPNILVIMGDDIGWYNPSIYNRGDMGYRTPNIDRIGKEGAMFTGLVRPAGVHGRSSGVCDRSVADPHRPDQSRHLPARTSASARRSHRRGLHEDTSATRRASSARTTSAI